MVSTPFIARILTTFVVMVVVALLTFLLIDLAPGSYLDDLSTNPQISAATLDRLRVEYGLDQPFYRKFWRWGRGVAAGDLGYSFVYQRPIRQLIAERIGNTLLLNTVALVTAWTLGLTLGLAAAAARDSPVDWAITALMTLLLSTPVVVLATVALAAAARFGQPVGGRHLLLPALAVAAVWLPAIARHTRTAVLSALAAPYVLAARAKGVGTRRLLFVHAAREALGPLSALFGVSLSALLSASLVVEVVMAWPGLGQLAYDAVFRRDIFLVVDLVQLSALLLLVGNTIGDLALRRADPRVSA